MRDLINIAVSLFEMANLSPEETGLPFMIWVSRGDGVRHDARLKVTLPPWGSHPEAVYQIRPFGFVAGKNWLSTPQEQALSKWVALNEKPLIDFWNKRIQYDSELRARLVGVGNAPPGNYQQAVIALRSSAPKLQSIRWHEGTYQLFFGEHKPNHSKVAARFSALDFVQPIKLHLSGSPEQDQGILLWSRTA